ncbi:MAG: inositol monophosphatase family protein [Candidatus Latescibacterota bacterium]
MSDSVDPCAFVERLLPVVRQCARASMVFYGQVADIGKAADMALTGELAQDASAAFTALDSGLQDIILSVVLQHFPTVRCIAEEDTALKRRFRGSRSRYAVILDPIDGTLHFRQGDAPYHICVGLACDGRMLAAVVARPSEDRIFAAVRGRGATVQTGDAAPEPLQLPPGGPPTNAIFISTKAAAYRPYAPPPLEPRDFPIGAALILTALAEGQLCAYLTRQVEVYDVAPPSLVAEEAGARCFLRGGRTPTYDRSRKFPCYMAAATPELVPVLFDIIRAGDKGVRG